MRTVLFLAVLLAPVSGRAACSVELAPVTFGTVDTRENSRGTSEVVVRCDAPSGFEVAISGARIVCGLPNAGAALVFERQGRTWSQVAALYSTEPVAGERFGMPNTL